MNNFNQTLRQLDYLKFCTFRRIDLLFKDLTGRRISRKVKADIKKATKENTETDNYIKEYAEDFELNYLPF